MTPGSHRRGAPHHWGWAGCQQSPGSSSSSNRQCFIRYVWIRCNKKEHIEAYEGSTKSLPGSTDPGIPLCLLAPSPLLGCLSRSTAADPSIHAHTMPCTCHITTTTPACVLLAVRLTWLTYRTSRHCTTNTCHLNLLPPPLPVCCVSLADVSHQQAQRLAKNHAPTSPSPLAFTPPPPPSPVCCAPHLADISHQQALRHGALD
jgi:hypothetical protein